MIFFVAAPAAHACSYAVTEPLIANGEARYIFIGTCGFYEVGYRLEGNTLYFPREGEHTIRMSSDDEAQRLLRETYGLVGSDNNALIRTKGLID